MLSLAYSGLNYPENCPFRDYNILFLSDLKLSIMNKLIGLILLNIVVMVNVAIALPIKDSGNFDHNYEGDVSPLSIGSGNLTFDTLLRNGSPLPDLGTYGGGAGYIGDSLGGILDLKTAKATPSPGNSYIYFGKSTDFNPAVGWTVEFRVKALSSNDASGPREGLAFSAGGHNGQAAWLEIGTDRVQTSYSSSGSIVGQDNSADFVTYRMAVLPGGQSWNLYRNGETLSGYNSTVAGASDVLSFGDQSGTGLGHHQIDYIRVDTSGAFAPVQAVDHVVDMGGDGAGGQSFNRAILGQNFKIVGSELTGGNSSIRGVAGGSFAEVYDWKTHEGVNPRGNTLEYLRAARDLNSEPIITINVHGVAGEVSDFSNFSYTDTSIAGRVAHAEDWVRYVNGVLPAYRQGDSVPTSDQNILNDITWSSKQLAPGEAAVSKVTYWEIGNEPGGPRGGFQLSNAEYKERYRQITSAMLAVDPTIKVGATATLVRGDQPISSVINDLSLPIDFIVYHPYDNMGLKFDEVLNDPTPDIAGLESRLRGSGDRIRNEHAISQGFLVNAGRDPNQVEHVLSEWNPMSYLHYTAQSSQAMALASAESIFTMADLNIRAANIWGTLVYDSHLDAEFPVTKLFRKMSEHMGDTLIDQYKVGNLHVYTVIDSETGIVTVWGLNFSDSEDASLVMSLSNLDMDEVDVMGMTLKHLTRDTSLLDISGLSGSPIDWVEGALAGFDPGLFTLDVPQASIRLLVIGNSVPEPGTMVMIVLGTGMVFSVRRLKHRN